MDILANLTANLDQLTLSSLSLSDAVNFLSPLAIFIGAILVYSMFIFKFYKFISKKDIFKFELAQTGRFIHIRRGLGVLNYILKYILIYPVVVSFCFLVLVVLFVFLSKEQTISTILLIAMTLVATIRIVSYYSEDLSQDLAKMIPFAILGVFLVDMGYFSVGSSLEKLAEVPNYIRTIVYYIGFVFVIEILLRILSAIPLGREKNKS